MFRALAVSLVTLGLLLVGCSSGDELLVDVHTDFLPGAEFDSVAISTSAGSLTEAATMRDWLAGVRIGPVDSASGAESLVVELRSGGRVVARRSLRINVRGTVVVPVWLVRICADVLCPDPAGDALATECDFGRCVRPDCIELGDLGCEAPECVGADDCAAPPAACATADCREGRCVTLAEPTACGAGAFCDPESGCTPLPADAGPPPDVGATDAGPSCPGSQTRCAGSCVDTSSDAAHCGECGRPCNMGRICSDSRCVMPPCPGGTVRCSGECVSLSMTHQTAGCGICDSGWGDCLGAVLGCETPLGTSSDCTRCGDDCSAAGFARCEAGGCTGTLACSPGTGDCTAAAGCETPLGTLSNCTACGEDCAAAHLSTCTGAGCAGPCEAGWAECTAAPGCETALGTLLNCTSCGENCAAAHLTTCTGAGCTGPCEAGWAECTAAPGCETALGTLTNCTSCGENCAAAHLTTCTGGGCTGPCEGGWSDCTGGAGCETPLGTLTNCTSCGENCAAAHLTMCTAAGCAGPCEGGFADCNAGPGCETPLGTLFDCTGCGENCAAAHLINCTGGGCAGPCAPGWCDMGPGPGCETPC